MVSCRHPRLKMSRRAVIESPIDTTPMCKPAVTTRAGRVVQQSRRFQEQDDQPPATLSSEPCAPAANKPQLKRKPDTLKATAQADGPLCDLTTATDQPRKEPDTESAPHHACPAATKRQRLVRLDALIADTLQRSNTAPQRTAAAARKARKQAARLQVKRRRVPAGLRLTADEFAAVHDCALVEEAYESAAAAVREQAAELQRDMQLLLVRSAAVKAHELRAGELKAAARGIGGAELRPALQELQRVGWELQLQEREAEIYVSVSEVKTAEAQAAAAEMAKRMMEAKMRVPRGVRLRGVAAALLGEAWAA